MPQLNSQNVRLLHYKALLGEKLSLLRCTITFAMSCCRNKVYNTKAFLFQTQTFLDRTTPFYRLLSKLFSFSKSFLQNQFLQKAWYGHRSALLRRRLLYLPSSMYTTARIALNCSTSNQSLTFSFVSILAFCAGKALISFSSVVLNPRHT